MCLASKILFQCVGAIDSIFTIQFLFIIQIFQGLRGDKEIKFSDNP